MKQGDKVYAQYDGAEVCGRIVLRHKVGGELMYFVSWNSGACWYKEPLLSTTPRNPVYSKQISLFDEVQ